MEVRLYREADLEACYALDQVCFSLDIAYTRAELRYFLTRRQAYAIVAEAEAGGIVSGFLVANESRVNRAGEITAHIVTLDVAPDMRRSGIGAALMAEAERHFRERGAAGMALEVAVDNEPALQFYRRHGFVIGKRLAGYYSGRLDAWAMSKRLA